MKCSVTGPYGAFHGSKIDLFAQLKLLPILSWTIDTVPCALYAGIARDPPWQSFVIHLYLYCIQWLSALRLLYVVSKSCRVNPRFASTLPVNGFNKTGCTHSTIKQIYTWRMFILLTTYDDQHAILAPDLSKCKSDGPLFILYCQGY